MKITQQKLIELERAQRKLLALEAGGVDNWEWYSEALKDFNREEEIDERIDALIDELQIIFGECAFEPSERGAGIAFEEDAYKQVIKLFNDHHITFTDLDCDD